MDTVIERQTYRPDPSSPWVVDLHPHCIIQVTKEKEEKQLLVPKHFRMQALSQKCSALVSLPPHKSFMEIGEWKGGKWTVTKLWYPNKMVCSVHIIESSSAIRNDFIIIIDFLVSEQNVDTVEQVLPNCQHIWMRTESLVVNRSSNFNWQRSWKDCFVVAINKIL